MSCDGYSKTALMGKSLLFQSRTLSFLRFEPILNFLKAIGMKRELRLLNQPEMTKNIEA